MPPRRSTRVASASLETAPVESLPVKRKRGQTLEPHNIELEEGDDVESKPKRGKRGSSVVKPSRPPRRSSRAATASLETAPVESLPIKQKRGQTIQSHILEEEEIKLEEEEEVDANLKRADIDEEAPPISNGRRTADEDEDFKPIRRGRKVPTARKVKVTTKKSIKATVIEDSDDDSDIQPPPVAQPRSQHDEAANAAHVVTNTMPAAEEEERSLFDPPPMPVPSNLPRAIPEEPTGPKSRLVIHKMVLVNFKSYAGRQEIGPFHKVNYHLDNLLQLKLTFSMPTTVVLLHCGSQRIRKIQYHRCSLICIRIPRFEDEAGQDIRTHPHFCKFPRS